MTNILKSGDFQCRVSTVLNKDVSQYGKQLIFDGKEDTCWCSDQKSPQWVALQWKNPVKISAFQIQFQGGFVGQDCEIIMLNEDNEQKVEPFYPEDVNSLQRFQISSSFLVKQITLKFNSSTDFFGRIIIYHIFVYS